MGNREKLVLFDLDGTLIDSDYQITDDQINAVINRAQEVGHLVGLNSDTPYEALVRWRDHFGMNGPLIAEKGAVVEIGGAPQYEVEEDMVKVDRAKAFIREFAQDNGYRFWEGNPVEEIRRGTRFQEIGQTAILLNNLSRCSLRFFVRRIDQDGSLAIDNSLTQDTIERLRPLFPDFDINEEDNNPVFGLMIVAREGITKRTGVRKLLGGLGLNSCVMVGNSMTDFVGDDLAIHVAVANADADFKNCASVVTDDVLTKGCIEYIDSLLGASG